MKKLTFIAIISILLTILITCSGNIENEPDITNNNENIQEEKNETEKYKLKKIRVYWRYKTNMESYYDQFDTIGFLLTQHRSWLENPFVQIDHNTFIDNATKCYNLIDKDMKEEEFTFVIRKLIATFNDGHAEYAQNKTFLNCLPISFWWFDDGLYIVGTTDEYSNLLHKKVLKIGGQDVNRLREKVNEYIPSDNIYGKKSRNSFYLSQQDMLGFLDLTDEQNEVSITYLNTNNKKKVILSTEARTISDSLDTRIASTLSNYKNYNVCRNSVTKLKDGDDINSFQIIDSYSLAYLKIISFSETRETAKKNIELVQNTFSEIKKHNVKHLIIDIRGNNGGSSNFEYKILSFLKNDNIEHLSTYDRYKKNNKEKIIEKLSDGIINLKEQPLFKDNNDWYCMPFPEEDMIFDGNIYVFIDNDTFSAGSTFAAIIKDNDYGTLIGQPTSNSSISFSGGSAFSIEEPFKLLELYDLDKDRPILFIGGRILVRCDEEARNREPDAIQPHINIPTTIEDHINGIDPYWEYVIEQIETR